MANNSPSLLHQRRFLLVFVIWLILAVSVSGCGTINQLRATATPTATATNTPTPTSTPTPTPTPTPTLIPPPQGEWSQYWDSNQIYDLLIDRQGYLWGRGLGTIIRWNTREGTYQEFGTSQGLPANIADKIFLGPSGEVWLFFQDHGLYQFDDPDWISHLEEGEIPGYRLDATALGPDGTLWICTEESLSSFDGQDWFSLDVEGGMVEGICEYLTVDLDGDPWMQGVDGPSVYHDPDWIVFTIEGVGFKYDTPKGAYTAPNGTVWFAYGGEGMLWFDGTYWQRAKIPPKDFELTSTGKAWLLRDGGFSRPDDLNEYKYGVHVHVDFESGSDPVLVQGWHWNLPFHGEMPVDEISEMYPGISNDLWMTYKEGLIHLARGAMELIPIEGVTSASAINDFVISRTGQIYLAFDEGIHKFTGNQTQPLLTGSELIGTNIASLAVDPNGTLWLVSSHGLQSFDSQSWSRPDLPGGVVYDLTQGPGGEIWVYHNPYLSRWDGSSWESFNYQEIEDIPSKYVNAMFVDNDGVLWVGFSNDGYISFDGTDWTSYFLDEESDLGYIRDIARDQTGTVYLLTRSGGKYYLYWQDDQVWESQELNASAAAFRRHPNGDLWLLLRDGELYALHNGKMEPVGIENPAPEAFMYDLVFGLDGSIWLATSQGAFRYDNQVWESYTLADGLREDRVNTLATGLDGDVWFAGSGLTRLGPPLP